MVVRQDGCIAGLAIALRCFELVDDQAQISASAKDGDVVSAGTRIAKIRGDARSILSAERLALNLLGQMSGVATETRTLVDRVEGTCAKIIDTRKTVPLLRRFQKMAVVAGGGANHRMGLFDQVLIKDNHIEAVGSPAEAVRRARAHVGEQVTVEVEIERLEDLEQVIEAGADIVMLDNMTPVVMRAAVVRTDGRVILEASGGITLENVREVAESGVDLISIGRLTHSSSSLDVALDFGS